MNFSANRRLYLPIDNREAYLFSQFVTHRYERSSTIITSYMIDDDS
jgi:hypothetical protein